MGVHTEMNLSTENGGLLASNTFEYAVFYRDAAHLVGKFPHLLFGKNLQSLIPLFCLNEVPATILKSNRMPLLPTVFRAPFELLIEKTEERNPETDDRLAGLGYPLSFGVPSQGNQRWFLVEGAGFTAIHPQASFEYLCPVGRGREWQLIFTSKVYELSFSTDAQAEGFKRLVYLSFPDTSTERAPNSINRFSVYDEEMSNNSSRRLLRFRAHTITPIPRRQMDTTRMAELPGRLCVGDRDSGLGRATSLQEPGI
jgi:hypothetical protein